MKVRILIFLLLLLGNFTSHNAVAQCLTTYNSNAFVNAAVTASGDGSSWATAFKTLQEAITVANACPSITQIWVARGTYYPDEGGSFANNDITAAFVMKNNLGIFGGFSGNGTETLLSQRDWTANPTILSGDINKNNILDNAVDSRHVIFNNFTSGAPLSSSAVLDGFTISGGYGSGYSGGGMYNKYASPTISHCNFSNNRVIGGNGGGVYNEDCSPTISYCTFSNNQASNAGSGGSGGGMYNNNSSPAVSHSTFSNNISSGSGVYGGGMANSSSSPTVSYCTFANNGGYTEGGGMSNQNSSPSVSNCIFSGNLAVSYGGGIYNVGGCTGSIINCTFSGNSAFYGGGICNNSSGSQPTVKNCLVWGNDARGNAPNEILNLNAAAPGVTYCDVKGGYIGTGNINANPLFVNAGDFHLQAGSPAINAGTNTGASSTDIEGNSRALTVADPADMGAYEYVNPCAAFSNNRAYVNANATGANNGISWANAFTKLQDALALSCPNVTQIWVAQGTYYPSLGVDINQDEPTARAVTFQLFEGVKVYGGFSGNGTEIMLSQRNVAANVTTLSGDIGNPNDNSDNACHVVYATSVTSATVLDGFTITAGNANIPAGFGHNQRGSGMLNLSGSSPTIANCTFSGNSAANFGGAIYNYLNSSPNVINCAFYGNSGGGGGAMSNVNSSSPVLVNCTFSGNSAKNGAGGAVYNLNSSSPVLTNCTFSGNSSDAGGAIFNFGGSSPILKNCIIWNNKEGNVTSTSGSSIFNTNGSLYVPSNPLISYSIIANSGGSGGSWVTAVGTDAGNNKNSDPLFIDPDGADNVVGTADDNLQLSAFSPAINAGTNTGAPVTDIEGNLRALTIADPADMGAYEFQGVLQTFYHDADGDTFGDPLNPIQAYIAPTGYVSNNTDCNDDPANGGAAINPGATEVCDGIDNNCDGNIDEGFTNTDADALTDCVDPDDDNDGTLDGADCAPLDASKWRTGSFYTDSDGDGFGTGTAQLICYGAITPTGFSSVAGDCNDNNSAIKPGATEVCDGIDNNCDGNIDEGFTNSDTDNLADCVDPDDDNDSVIDTEDCAPLDASKWRSGTFYADSDGDGFGFGTALTICYGTNLPAGFVTNNADCNDLNSAIKPGATEICGNGIDDNCNGIIDENCAICQNATGFTTTNITSTSAQLNWVAAINPSQWNVQYKSTKQGSKWIDVPVTVGTRSAVLNGLALNQNYQWRIRANCNNIWTPYSADIKFITKSSGRIAVEEEEIIENEISLKAYPNPATYVLNIQINATKEGVANFTMMNILGQKVNSFDKTLELGTNTLTIDIQQLKAGLYFLRVVDNAKKISIVKVQKQ